MIVTCPTCLRKYEVSSNVIGDSRMVRCVVCGTTWQQDSVLNTNTKSKPKNYNSVWKSLCSVAFFGLVSVYMYFYTPYIVNIPKYYSCLVNPVSCSKCNFDVKKISHFFVKKDDGNYVKIEGEIENLSDVPLSNLKLVFNLKTFPDDKIEASLGDSEIFFNETWVEDIKSESVTPSGNIAFSSVLKKVPMHDILCTIKLDKKNSMLKNN